MGDRFELGIERGDVRGGQGRAYGDEGPLDVRIGSVVSLDSMTTPNLLPVTACHPSLSSRPDERGTGRVFVPLPSKSNRTVL